MIGFGDEAILIDFGMASVFDPVEVSPNLQLKAGTHMYFAPEMFSNINPSEVFGPATDIWALGSSIYEMLTGRSPYYQIQSFFQLKEAVGVLPIDFSLIKNEKARHIVERMLHFD